MIRQSHLPTLQDTSYFCLPESVGWYSERGDHFVDRQKGALNNFSIHLVIDGTGYVEWEERKYKLRSGDAFLYFPLQQQKYYSSSSDPWNIIWIHFYGFQLHEFLIKKDLHRTVLWTVRQWKSFETQHQQLLEEAETYNLLHPSKLSILTYALLVEFIDQAEPKISYKKTATDDRIRDLLPRMQRHAHEPFTLDRWAAEVGVSSYYFCKLFRKIHQMSPMDFITRCRIQQAKQMLLEHEDWPIKEIAALAGYESPSYFNKRFFNNEKMTPSDYRKLYLASHNRPSSSL